MRKGSAGQLRLELGRVAPTEQQLRAAHQELRVPLPFEQAINDTCFRICIANFCEARRRAKCRRGKGR